MEYLKLIQSCEETIKNKRCLGCQALENSYFRGNPNCIYNKIPTAEESIKQIKINLGIKEKQNEI